MNDPHDDILTLLQDVKEMLYGVGLLLLGGLLSGMGLFVGSWCALLLFLSIPLMLSGALHLWHGWQAHEVVVHKPD